MTTDNDDHSYDDRQLSFNNLKRKQSVRATFKLPPEIIDLLGVIATQLRIKQKSLLDQLIEDTSLLGNLAREAHQTSRQNDLRRQKTYVISRSSLRSLNEIARRKNIPRDTLVEFSIRRLVPVIETELEKHNKRKIILNKMKEHMQQVKLLCQQAEKSLGEDDIILDMLNKQLGLAKKNIAEADSVIKKGMPMEEW